MMIPGTFLMRHAPTAYNDPGKERLRGQRDVPPSPEGLKIALDRAQFFKTQDIQIERVYCADLKRDKAMADAIHKVTGAKIIMDSRCTPWDMGNLTGEPAETADKELIRYMFDTPDKAIPGGEAFNNFARRWLPLVQECMAGKGTAIATHLRNLVTTKAWDDAGREGVKLDPKDRGIMDPFKKVEIALMSPTEGFIVMQVAKTEEEMVTR